MISILNRSVPRLMSSDATVILRKIAEGDSAAATRLLPLVYDELRALAAKKLRFDRPDHTLQATALVHEAFLKMVHQTDAQWNGRAHFFAVAATAMRQILTDYARRKATEKRGGDWERVTLENIGVGSSAELDVLRLEELLKKLAEIDDRKHRVVELRFFGGLGVEEVAEAMGLSKTTVEGEWRAARAWLAVELSR